MKVKDLMSTNITCVREDTPAYEIAGHMRKNNIGSLPVCDDAGHLKGIVTDRDLTLRVLAKYRCSGNAVEDGKDTGKVEPAAALLHTKAGEIMSTSPVAISPDASIHHASLLFSSHKIRRLPVVEASKLVGFLSLGDVAVKPVYIDEAGDALSAISLADGLQAKN